jgi:hypothetical protein
MIAVDTNVLIYACDQADPRRQTIAFDLVTNAQDGVLLWQVACEFLSASRGIASPSSRSYCRSSYRPTPIWCAQRRSILHEEHRYGMPSSWRRV